MGLHIAVACRGETHQGRIDPCLDDAIKTRQIAHRGRAENYSGGSPAEPAADFLQGCIVAWFHPGQIQLGRSLDINDFLLAQLRKKGNGHLHFSVRKGIHERLKAVAIGCHASIIASPATRHFCPGLTKELVPSEQAVEACVHGHVHEVAIRKGLPPAFPGGVAGNLETGQNGHEMHVHVGVKQPHGRSR